MRGYQEQKKLGKLHVLPFFMVVLSIYLHEDWEKDDIN